MLKKTLYILLLSLLGLLFLNSCSAQELKSSAHTSEIYEPYQVHQKGEFEGGKKQLFQLLSSNLEYPIEAIEKNIQGKIIIKFVIERNGTISNFETLKDIGFGCANEIVRVLGKTQARWNSAKINNKRVRSYYILSVNFKIPTDNSKPYIQDANN